MDRIKAEEDLAFIRKVMEDSKNKLAEFGFPYIIFGAASILGTALTYVAIFMEQFALIPWIWVALGVLAGIVIAVFFSRQARKSPRTFAGGMYAMVWTGTAVLDLVVGLSLFLTGHFSIGIMLALVAASLGLAYFITSTLTRNRGMLFLSFIWWAGCLPMALIGDFYAPFIMVGLVVACELIPGIILHARWVRLQRGGRPAEAD